MANNNINLKFISEDSQLDKSLKKLGSIEGRIKKLVSAEQKGQITTQQFNKRIATLATEFQRVSGGSIAARNSLFKFSREVYQSSKATDQLTNSTNRLAVASKNAASHVQVVGKRANRTGVLAQQAGYQFGDFAVQVQSGTNPLIAFSQQATQLIGTFSMLATSTRAIMAFSALGVIVPVVSAVAGALMRVKEESKGVESNIQSLTSAINDYERAVSISLMTTEELDDEFGSMSERMVKLQDLFKNIALSRAMDTLKTGTGLFNQELSDAALNLQKIQDRLDKAKRVQVVEKLEADIQKTASALGLLPEQVTKLNKALKDVHSSETMEGIRDRSAEALDFIEEMGFASGKIPPDVAKIGENLREVLGAATRATAGAEGLNSELSGAADEAARIASNLEVAASFNTGGLLGEFGAVPTGLDAFGGEGAYIADSRYTDKPSKGKKKQGGTQRDALLDLQKRIALDTKLLGVSREQAQVERAIANSKIKYSDQEIANTVKELEVYNLKLARIKETQALYGTVQSSLESGFMAMVDGTKSVEDAFKDMAKSVIAELYRVLVVKRMVGSFEAGTGIMGFLGGIFGKASGGTVMSGTPYLVGEKGPELIVPQNRGHVMNADLTAKAMNGSKGETVVVNQTINVSTGVQQTVRSEIKQLMPQIAQSAKSAVVDAKRRGGSYGRAFS